MDKCENMQQILLQTVYSWIGHRLQTVLTLAFFCGCTISKLRLVLDSSAQTTRGMYFECFRKISKWSRLAVFDVFGNFSENSMILRYWRHVSKCAYYKRRTSFGLRVIELLKKLLVRTSYRLYLGLQSRSIEINRDQFLSKNTAAGLPKKIICRKTGAPQKHLRHPH